MPNSISHLTEKSGNNLHLDAADILRKAGWEVTISPYYLDDSTDKAREVDIIASKGYEYRTNVAQNSKFRKFEIKLFIECKYFPCDVVFWKDKISEDKVRKAWQYSVGISNNGGHIDEIFEKSHYYQFYKGDKISKLFSVEKGEDVIFNSFNQSLKSLIYFRNNLDFQAIYYPIVVFRSDPKSDVYTYDKSNDNSQSNIETEGLEVNYSFKDPKTGKGISKLFLVDFVRIDRLRDLLKVIEEDADKVHTNLSYYVH